LTVIDYVDFSTRFRSLEDDGFLRTGAATPACSQVSVILGRDVKRDSDDENLFEFPSDKKPRLAPCRLADEEDEDMFAFADEIKPKSLRAHSERDEPAESSGLHRKRRLQNSEMISESSLFSKRCASEKDVLQQQNTDSHKNEPLEESVTTRGHFLSVADKTKVRVFMMLPISAVLGYSDLQFKINMLFCSIDSSNRPPPHLHCICHPLLGSVPSQTQLHQLKSSLNQIGRCCSQQTSPAHCTPFHCSFML
jgi:hypothetical protein